AKAQAITRDLEKAKGPTTNDPVRNSTARRSAVKASWARFTRAMEVPKVRSSVDSSGASTTRRTKSRWSPMPTMQRGGVETTRETYGVSPSHWKRHNVV